MIDIEVFVNTCWRKIQPGPFPITWEQLQRARELAAPRLEKDLFGGQPQAPQTIAREVLQEVCPHLSNFDVMALGFAVTNQKIRKVV